MTFHALLVLLALAGMGCGIHERPSVSPEDDAGEATGDSETEDAPDPPEAAPSRCDHEGAQCAGESLVTCEDGLATETACPLGCDADANACILFVPRNVGTRVALDGSGREAIDLGDDPEVPNWIFDTTTGEIRGLDRYGMTRTLRPAGAGIAAGIEFVPLAPTETEVHGLGVFAVRDLRVPATATLIGYGERPLVLLAEENVLVEGAITVAADSYGTTSFPGPGGEAPNGTARTGRGGIGRSMGTASGGGAGGSLAGRGGRGGGDLGGASGQIALEDAVDPLAGGCAGGGGGGAGPGAGGNGGGALQITAGRSVLVTGVVDASGGGGGGARPPSARAGQDTGGGGGGGSGGAILIQAPDVRIEGIVLANGGGGGQGAPCPGCRGIDGRKGNRLEIPAPGSAANRQGGGGGAGSDREGRAFDGGALLQGGGGGGGAGRIRIETLEGDERFEDLSPSLESGFSAVGRIEDAP